MQNLLTFIFFITALVLFVYKIQARTADEIIEKHIAAIGGETLVNDIYNICMIGTRDMMDSKVPVQVVKVQGKLFRTDFFMMQKWGFMLINESGGWQYLPVISDKLEQITNEAFLALKDEMDISGPLINYISKKNKVKLIGKEELNGNDVYKIQVSFTSGRTIIFLIDTRNYLIVQTREMKRQSSENTNNKYVEVVTDFSEYKKIDGVLIAHKITNPGYGPLSGTVTFNKITVNQAIPDDIFLTRPLDKFDNDD